MKTRTKKTTEVLRARDPAAIRPSGLACAISLWLVLALASTSATADQIAILDEPFASLDARVHILESADRSIDILYFSVHDDLVTRATLALLREKALEGVRVRMVTAAKGFKVDRAILAHLQSLDDFEIRLYNVPTLSQPFRILRQLHDKVMLVDGDRYITGGRNLGEVYFDLAEKHNKRDRDVYVVGASAATAQGYFDELWESDEVEPARYKEYAAEKLSDEECDVVGPGATRKTRCEQQRDRHRAELESATEILDAAIAEARADPLYQQAVEEVTVDFLEISDEKVEFIHDPVEGANDHVGRVLGELVLETDGSVLVQTPYVVPDKEMFPLLEEMAAKGVRVVFVTNSVKSTVNTLAHAAYERYRKRMLDAGAIFVESTGEHMLHAKSIVLRNRDGSCIGGVGSFNVDPRSSNLNTETYVLVRDCEFADALEAVIGLYSADGITLESRDDVHLVKPLRQDVGAFKKFQIAVMRFLTPLYRSQI